MDDSVLIIFVSFFIVILIALFFLRKKLTNVKATLSSGKTKASIELTGHAKAAQQTGANAQSQAKASRDPTVSGNVNVGGESRYSIFAKTGRILKNMNLFGKTDIQISNSPKTEGKENGSGNRS